MANASCVAVGQDRAFRGNGFSFFAFLVNLGLEVDGPMRPFLSQDVGAAVDFVKVPVVIDFAPSQQSPNAMPNHSSHLGPPRCAVETD